MTQTWCCCLTYIYYPTLINFFLRYAHSKHPLNKWMTEFQQSHSLYRLRNCSEVTCLRWLSSYMLGLEFTSELPSPFTSAPGAPIQLSGVHVIPPSPELEALKIQDIFFSYESGFCWLLENQRPWNKLELLRVIFRKGGGGSFPLPTCHSGRLIHNCAGGGCWAAPRLKIVSWLKNGLIWPVMPKSTAGSTRAVCNNLGGVSLRKSVNSAVFLLIETILSLHLWGGTC